MDKKLTDLIQALRKGGAKLPPSKQLMALSALPKAGQPALLEAWPAIPVETRRSLVGALVEMAGSDANADFAPVFRLALDDRDEDVRLAALEGLWEEEDETFAPVLIRIMQSDSSVDVRAAAAVSLGHFAMSGELEEIDPRLASEVRAALLATIRSPEQDNEVRRRALEAVSCMSGDDIAGLIRAAYRERDDQMTVSALFAMGRSLDEEWAPYVQRELKNARPEIRHEAARAAGELELTDAVPNLLEMLYDPESGVREAAIEALGNIGGERPLQALAELARSDNDSIRRAALDALEVARFNDDPLTPEVLSWLFDRELGDSDEEDGFDDEDEEDRDDED